MNEDNFELDDSDKTLYQQALDTISSLRQQLAEARAWKESALLVEKEWDAQAVGKEIGVPLGSSIRKNILPWIKKTKAELATLKEGV